MRLRYILLFAAIFVCLGRVAAQYSDPRVGGNTELSVPIPALPVPIDADVVNLTEAELIRKALWRDLNLVDFRVSVTGIVTQFNKSWKTNNQNAVSVELSANYYHTYSKGRHTSLFKFDGIYGLNNIDELWFKNQDMFKLYYLSSWAVKKTGLLRNWAYSFSTTFMSQFSRGYKGRSVADRNIVWSNFMAPGTLNAGLGLTYTSHNRKLPFIVTINPVSGNALFVLDNGINDLQRSKLGIALPSDAAENKFKYNRHRYKIEGGSNLTVDFNRTFTFGKNKGIALQYKTTLSSFYGWMTQVAKHKVDETVAATPSRAIVPIARWANSLIFDPIRFITLEFRTTALYDRSQVDKVQMQYYLRVGLTYKYKNK